MELSKFGLVYEQQRAIKAQALADFVVEMTKPEGESTGPPEWTFYVDGSSNDKGSGVEVILKGPNDMTLKYSLKFKFQATNNQAEYEALAADLRLAKEIGAKMLCIRSDSQLVITQVKGEYEVKDPLLIRYVQMIQKLLEDFDYNLERILREENGQANALAKLANVKAVVNNRTII